MVCRLSADSLPEFSLTFCQMDPPEQNSVKYEYGYVFKDNTFENVVCTYDGHFVQAPKC